MHRAARVLVHLTAASSSRVSADSKARANDPNSEPRHKIALVTGGNRGIGKAVVAGLAKDRNFTVVLTALDAKDGQAAVADLHAQGLSNVHMIVMDVSSADSVKAGVRSVLDKFKRIDVLVNNAGIIPAEHFGPLSFEIDPEEISRVMQVNAAGAARLCHAIVPRMVANNFGRIVNVSSRAGQLAYMSGGMLPYRMSKAALNALTRAVSADTRTSNVLVNAVCPGNIDTEASRHSNVRSFMKGAEWHTPEQGADTVIWLATLPTAPDSPRGKFFAERRVIPW